MDDSAATESVQPTAAKSRNPLRRLYNWVISWAEHPAGPWVLFIVSMLDSCILLMPPYPFLIALSLGRPRRALFFAAICSLGSLLGAIGGYFIGGQLWEWTRSFFFDYLGWMGFTQENFIKVQQLYQDNAFWVILTAGGLAPLPFKVFTIGAGVFHVPFWTFVAATAIARTARFFAVAVLLYFWGDQAQRAIDRYFNWVAIAFIVLVILGFVALWLFGIR